MIKFTFEKSSEFKEKYMSKHWGSLWWKWDSRVLWINQKALKFGSGDIIYNAGMKAERVTLRSSKRTRKA